jgi:hypothetical protein
MASKYQVKTDKVKGNRWCWEESGVSRRNTIIWRKPMQLDETRKSWTEETSGTRGNSNT